MEDLTGRTAFDERATPLIFRGFRNTARVARNGIAKQVIAAEANGQPFEDIAQLVKGIRGKEGLHTGDTEHGISTAGLVQGLINDIPTVAELVDRIVDDALALIRSRFTHMDLGSTTGAEGQLIRCQN